MQGWESPELRRRPAGGCWQAFTDGSYTPGRGVAYSCVFWSPSGKLSTRWMGFSARKATSVEAELEGVMLAVRMREKTVPGPYLFEGWQMHLDCRSAVNMLSGNGSPSDRRLRRTIDEIRRAAGDVEFLWVPRKENRDADQCAQRAYSLERPGERAVLYRELTAAELDARQAWGEEARRIRKAQSASAKASSRQEARRIRKAQSASAKASSRQEARRQRIARRATSKTSSRLRVAGR